MRTNDDKNRTFDHEAEKGFQIGLTDQGSARKVAMSISVNFNLKDGAKERGHSLPIHEIPLLRRMHPGGTVDVLAYWPPGVDRVREMTQENLKGELERLARSYGIKKPGEAATVLQEVYGATETEQLTNLHAKMLDVAMAWKALQDEGAKRLTSKYPNRKIHRLEFHGLLSEVITAEEIDKIVDIIEPRRGSLEEVQLPELGEMPGQVLPRGDSITTEDALGGGLMTDGDAGDDIDPVDWMTAELRTRLKLNGEDALAIASLIVEANEGKAGSDPDAVKLSTVAVLKKADGSLHGTKHQQVLAVAAKWREKQAAALTAG